MIKDMDFDYGYGVCLRISAMIKDMGYDETST